MEFLYETDGMFWEFLSGAYCLFFFLLSGRFFLSYSFGMALGGMRYTLCSHEIP